MGFEGIDNKDPNPVDFHKYLVWAMSWVDESPKDLVEAEPNDWNPEHEDTVYLSIDLNEAWDEPGCYRYLWTEKWAYFLVNEWIWDEEEEEHVENWRMWWVPRGSRNIVDES